MCHSLAEYGMEDLVKCKEFLFPAGQIPGSLLRSVGSWPRIPRSLIRNEGVNIFHIIRRAVTGSPSLKPSLGGFPYYPSLELGPLSVAGPFSMSIAIDNSRNDQVLAFVNFYPKIKMQKQKIYFVKE